jgi:L-ascorbate metabolism protein UlaG (beta-lactamase superfamily)
MIFSIVKEGCMEITYLGHSSFKLKGKTATLVTDPYEKSVGFLMPKVSADIITVSHDHADHNAVHRVAGTTRRPEPYVINAPGEYEISQVGVFGWRSHHDGEEGNVRGRNTIYTIHMDMMNIVHLGDLGHSLSDELIENLGLVDVLCIPVGGVYTIDAKEAVKVIATLKPSIVIPMHYKLANHSQDVYGGLAEVSQFLKEMEVDMVEPINSLKVTDADLPEETEVKILKVSG